MGFVFYNLECRLVIPSSQTTLEWLGKPNSTYTNYIRRNRQKRNTSMRTNMRRDTFHGQSTIGPPERDFDCAIMFSLLFFSGLLLLLRDANTNLFLTEMGLFCQVKLKVLWINLMSSLGFFVISVHPGMKEKADSTLIFEKVKGQKKYYVQV